MLTIRLPHTVDCLDINWSEEIALHGGHVVPPVLLGGENGLQFPVRPVEIVFKDGDGERMADTFGQYQPSLVSMDVTAFNHTQFSIGPVQQLRWVVNGEPIGPVEVLSVEHKQRAAVH